MADLVAIVRATRSSARAVEAMRRWDRVASDALRAGAQGRARRALVAYRAAWVRRQAALVVLAANPLAGDV